MAAKESKLRHKEEELLQLHEDKQRMQRKDAEQAQAIQRLEVRCMLVLY